MEQFTNDKGEVIVIADMENPRLVHSIAKYAQLGGYEEVVKALKAEAMARLFEAEKRAN
jgi:hypothetical protein